MTNAVTVTTTSGRVRGEAVDGVAVFRAVPYAAAPVGELRFAGPVSPRPWEGIREAVRPGPTAPQGVSAFPGLDLSPLVGDGWRRGDEYLTVDVRTPDPGAGSLPVMVFLHGGAFVTGTGSAPVYDGTAFACQGAVFVTINYRLGIEGFLPLDGGATNVGLRDQLAALRWVRDNAAAFGGDPGNVTVLGESAGAISIACLLSSPLARGLFRRAIVQSGHPSLVRGIREARVLAEHLGAWLGVPATAEGFRTVPPERLVEAQAALVPGGAPDLRDADGFDPAFGLTWFLPVVGDDVLPHDSRGATGDVDLVVGTCADELRLYLVPSGVLDAVDEEEAVAMLSVSHPDARTALEARGLGKDGRSAGDVLAETMTDLIFKDPARKLAAAHRGRTFCYRFDWRSPRFEGRLGACHALELPFVFDTLAAAAGPLSPLGDGAPEELARFLNRAWFRFASTGDPGWPEYAAPFPILHADVTPEVRNG